MKTVKNRKKFPDTMYINAGSGICLNVFHQQVNARHQMLYGKQWKNTGVIILTDQVQETGTTLETPMLQAFQVQDVSMLYALILQMPISFISVPLQVAFGNQQMAVQPGHPIPTG